ncbi:MAG TPA: metal-dependent transcriptional regulator [Gemmatimonadaceae bacterium]|nr:metal-dependent transcriptional regulator [Gemmatimonadaceae bacterium]
MTPTHVRKKSEQEPTPRRAPSRPPSSTVDPRDLTGPVEDYLKAIYELERDGAPAATNDLATHLGVAPASVTGMVRRLADQGLLTHERYRGVRLTAQGRRGALRTLRRHRVIEAYLVKALGYRWDEVHDEAERLEHAASDDLIDRMAEAIGEPTVDPHGAPIPSREGAVEEARYRSLSELEPGMAADVMRVEDEDPELLRYLAELTLMPGITVRMVERAPFGGPITVEIDHRDRQIGPALAERVLVRPRRTRS